MESVHYQQIQPERDVSGDNFSKGQINFNWTMDSRGYVNFAKSYIKIRIKLSKADGTTQLALTDNIAPSMFLADNLFQSMKIQLNNQVLSEIGDYVPQIAALKQRMYRSDTDLNNYGASTNFTQASYLERHNQISHQGLVLSGVGAIGVGTSGNTNVPFGIISKKSRQLQTFELIWKPCLGLFDVDGFVPCSQGLFNLQLSPQPFGQYQLFAIESVGSTKIPNIAAPGQTATQNSSYKFEVLSMQMYVLKGIGAPIVNKSLTLNIKEIRCQSQNLTTFSLHQKTFQIHPRTNALTIAYQQPGAGSNDTRFPASKFKSGGAGNAIGDNDELKLTRFWIRYGSKQLPTPIPDVEFNSSTDNKHVDFFVSRYNETLQYANLDTVIHSPEPLEKWFERGAYYHFAGYGDREKEDRCYISQQFTEPSSLSKPPNLLLFDHYNKTIKINISNSILRDVSVSQGAS